MQMNLRPGKAKARSITTACLTLYLLLIISKMLSLYPAKEKQQTKSKINRETIATTAKSVKTL